MNTIPVFAPKPSWINIWRDVKISKTLNSRSLQLKNSKNELVQLSCHADRDRISLIGPNFRSIEVQAYAFDNFSTLLDGVFRKRMDRRVGEAASCVTNGHIVIYSVRIQKLWLSVACSDVKTESFPNIIWRARLWALCVPRGFNQPNKWVSRVVLLQNWIFWHRKESRTLYSFAVRPRSVKKVKNVCEACKLRPITFSHGCDRARNGSSRTEKPNKDRWRAGSIIVRRPYWLAVNKAVVIYSKYFNDHVRSPRFSRIEWKTRDMARIKITVQYALS